MNPAAHLSDEALLAAFVGGDDRAFDALVDRHERRVYGICYRFFGNAADAEDAAQEAFVAVLRRAHTFSGAARFSTWMYRVAVNACNDLARKRSRRPQTVPLFPVADDGTAPVDRLMDPDDALANRVLGMELRAALDTLDPEYREAVVLHDVAGIPYAQLAARYGVAVGTVKSRIHRAHAQLAAVLEEPAGASATPRAAGLEPPRPVRPPTPQP